MKQEEKQLLIKDLCARLPYGVKCRMLKLDSQVCTLDSGLLGKVEILEPYLRPMSSMTREEYEDLCNSCTWLWLEKDLRTVMHGDYKCYDWLNAHHFDYRGLITMGLALEAPAGMYTIE